MNNLPLSAPHRVGARPNYQYISERSLQDLIWDKYRHELNPHGVIQNAVFHKEFEVGYGLTCDFAVTGFVSGQPLLKLIELKLTATIESVAQLANYIWVAQKNAWEVSPRRLSPAGPFLPNVHGHLWARHFDTGTHSLMEISTIASYRLLLEGNNLIVRDEPHPHISSPCDQASVDLFDSSWIQ